MTQGGELFRQRACGHGRRDTAVILSGVDSLRTQTKKIHIINGTALGKRQYPICFKDMSKCNLEVKIWPLRRSPYGHLEETYIEDREF